MFLAPSYLAVAVKNRRQRLLPLTFVFAAGLAFVLVPITLGMSHLGIGISQSPMLQGEPAFGARFLPGHGSTGMLIDRALTGGFDEMRSLLIALGWLAGLALTALLLFRRTASR